MGHTKLDLQVVLLETCFEDTSRRIENLKSTKFLLKLQFQQMNLSMLILQGVKCEVLYMNIFHFHVHQSPS